MDVDSTTPPPNDFVQCVSRGRETNGFIPQSDIFRNVDIVNGYLSLECGSVLQSTSSLELLNDVEAGISVSAGDTGLVTLLGEAYLSQTETRQTLVVDSHGTLRTDGGETAVMILQVQNDVAQLMPSVQKINCQECTLESLNSGITVFVNPDQPRKLVLVAEELIVGDVFFIDNNAYLVVDVHSNEVTVHTDLLPGQIGSYIIRGSHVDPFARLVEIVGHLSVDIPNFVVFLPNASDRTCEQFKVVNAAITLTSICVHCCDMDTIDKHARSVNLGMRSNATESSQSLTLVSNSEDTFYT